MKALVYTGTQELVYRDEKNPLEVSGESILKVHASGICGSDMHAYHGKDERRIPPLILGHEVSGEIQNGKFVMRLVEGIMKNGRREGKVKITYENGDIYIGELNENGNRHGLGKYIYSSGKVKEGVWENGKMVSKSKPI